MNQSAIDEVLNHPLSQELLARDLTRLAFIGLGGTPRSIPIGFTWNGAEIVMCTVKNVRKLPTLRRNPAVALTIDTAAHPPKVLLIRGQAELDAVDGIPEEHFQWNGTYQMTPWATGRVGGRRAVALRRHCPGRGDPTWAKLIDFETTLPTAIEELMQQQKERHGNCRDCSPKFRAGSGRRRAGQAGEPGQRGEAVIGAGQCARTAPSPARGAT